MASPADSFPTREHKASALKERVYITFSALAIILTMQGHGMETATPQGAVVTLAIGIFGTLLAMFVADLISHIAVHEKIPTRSEVRLMSRTTFGAFGAVVLPLLIIAASTLGWWELRTALRAGTLVLTASLIVIPYLAIRKINLTPGKKLIVLASEFVLSLLVIGLELLAHG